MARISRAGEITKTTISTLGTFEGLEKIDVKTAEAGDIVAVSGNAEITIGETLTDAQNPVALSVLKIEEPTIRMTFSVNTSPFAGREGKLTTSRHISERLYKERLDCFRPGRTSPGNFNRKT